MELLVPMNDFPYYQINSAGGIFNLRTNRYVARYCNNFGDIYVKLLKSDAGSDATKMSSRMLKKLVAEHFVEPDWDPMFFDSSVFDTPILLDNDRENCSAQNIKWRPRWFAHRYKRQFSDHKSFKVFSGIVRDQQTDVYYTNSYEACRTLGLLFDEFLEKLPRNHPIFPIRHEFEMVENSRI